MLAAISKSQAIIEFTPEGTITTANGLRIEFLELGRQARITYASGDGRCELDVLQTAGPVLTPWRHPDAYSALQHEPKRGTISLP